MAASVSHMQPAPKRHLSVAEPASVTQADARWSAPRPAWRERQVALPWPVDLLNAFSLRMASHGMSVSRPMMMGDKCYALQQLSDAHQLGDDHLRLLAVQLFRYFETRQSGIREFH